MRLGNTTIASARLGNNAVQAVYLGNNLVWQNAPVATAATGVGVTSFTANWNAYAGANYYLLDVSLNSSFSSFVGPYQNYLVYSASQIVSGLSSNTTYYYRVRAVTGIDSDAAAFITRVYNAGGALSYAEVLATETLVANMKAAGIWNSMKAIYPMVGASAAACAQNLKSSSFTGTFTATGWTFASTGVTPNGNDATFMNTGFNPSIDNIANSAHISFYSRTDITTSTISMGCYDGNNYNQLAMSFAGNTYWNINNASGDVVVISPTNSLGFFLASRTSSTAVMGQRNATQLTGSAAEARNNFNIYIGRPNNLSGYADTKQCAFASIGDGLTDMQASDFYTAVQLFNTTLNRSVGTPIVSDSDAQAYINRVYTAGGTLTTTEANAVNKLTIDMKAAGIWTPMKAIYPMVGASAAACAQNLKSSSFTGNFSAGGTFSSNGYTGNGVAYMDTGFLPSTEMTNNNTHISYYSRTDTTTGNVVFGTSKNASAIPLFTIYTKDVTPNYRFDSYSYVGNRITVASALTSEAFFINTRTTSTVFKAFRNGTQFGTTNTSTNLNDITTCDKSFFINALNLDGTAGQFALNQCAFASIGDGLTDTQAADLYNAVQIMNTTLSRQV